jgi:hypothetical protein
MTSGPEEYTSIISKTYLSQDVGIIGFNNTLFGRGIHRDITRAMGAEEAHLQLASCPDLPAKCL